MDFDRGIIILPLFHVAIPLLLFELPFVKTKYKYSRISLIIGSLIADVFDKSLLFLKLGSGRGISHSLFFVLISFLLIHLMFKKKSSISVPFLIGSLLHLLLDLPEVPLFYPFIEYDFLLIEDPLALWLYTLFNDPIVYLTELSGFIILLFILIRNKLFSFKSILNYFTIHSESSINNIDIDENDSR